MADPTPAAKAATPVTKATAPEGRGKRRVLTGVVTRDKMDKTRRVEVAACAPGSSAVV